MYYSFNNIPKLKKGPQLNFLSASLVIRSDIFSVFPADGLNEIFCGIGLPEKKYTASLARSHGEPFAFLSTHMSGWMDKVTQYKVL